MVSNDALINALRSLNFSFKDQSDRVMLYKQNGTSLRVGVRRNSAHEDDYARIVLKQAGMTLEAIDQFIREASR